MTEEADRYKEDDKRKRELVEARNNADALMHSTEKTLKELGDKVSAGDKSARNLHLYGKLGYKETGRKRLNENCDLIVMEKSTRT